MKALTLTQPWATLIALGEKRIETRGWATNHRDNFLLDAMVGIAHGAADPQEVARTVLRAGAVVYEDEEMWITWEAEPGA